LSTVGGWERNAAVASVVSSSIEVEVITLRFIAV
jgi:hypothetical protein